MGINGRCSFCRTLEWAPPSLVSPLSLLMLFVLPHPSATYSTSSALSKCMKIFLSDYFNQCQCTRHYCITSTFSIWIENFLESLSLFKIFFVTYSLCGIFSIFRMHQTTTFLQLRCQSNFHISDMKTRLQWNIWLCYRVTSCAWVSLPFFIIVQKQCMVYVLLLNMKV